MANMTFKTNLYPDQTETRELGSADLRWKINGVKDPKLTDDDTKNTAGATPDLTANQKLYLIGAKTQDTNPQTYTRNGVFLYHGSDYESFNIGIAKSGNTVGTRGILTLRHKNGIGNTDLIPSAVDSTISLTLPSTTGTLALEENITNYYWANINVSSKSQTNTTPSFKTVTLTSTDPGAHLAFSRTNYNYVQIPANAALGFGSDMSAWANMWVSIDKNGFHGELKGNATTATTASKVTQTNVTNTTDTYRAILLSGDCWNGVEATATKTNTDVDKIYYDAPTGSGGYVMGLGFNPKGNILHIHGPAQTTNLQIFSTTNDVTTAPSAETGNINTDLNFKDKNNVNSVLIRNQHTTAGHNYLYIYGYDKNKASGTAFISFNTVNGDTIYRSISINQRIATNLNISETNGFSDTAGIAGSLIRTNGSIELVGNTPYIDFHYNNSTANYNARIISDAIAKIHIYTDTINETSLPTGYTYGKTIYRPAIKSDGVLLVSNTIYACGASFINNTTTKEAHGLQIQHDGTVFARLYVKDADNEKGNGRLNLGNNTANDSTTAEGARGTIVMYGTKTNYLYIAPGAITENITIGATTTSNITNLTLDTGFKITKAATANSNNNLNSQLIISSSDSGSGKDVALELWRGTNASWQISNEDGILHFRNNYTSSKQNSYSVDAMTIAYNTGNVFIKGVITQGSDKNIKHNIQSIPKAYEQFYNNLQPKQFKYNYDTTERNRFGFIAQEVEEAYKKAELDYQDDAIIAKRDNNKQGEWDLNMMDIVPLNTWQIQQMKQEIELLKAEIAELRKLVKKDG